jgi:hypothetical protein
MTVERFPFKHVLFHGLQAAGINERKTIAGCYGQSEPLLVLVVAIISNEATCK